MSKALVKLLGNSDQWVRRSAAKALVVWATPDAEDALIKASQSEDVFLRNPAIEALGKLKTTKAAEAVAAQMYQQNGRVEVSKTLKAMGPAAEDATIALLKDRDEWVRGEACSVLGEIGGKKSLEALRNFTPKTKGFEESNSRQAIAAIEQRLESEPDTVVPEGGRPNRPRRTVLHRWRVRQACVNLRDTSGAFSVEAVMLSVENGNVVLQKKDGKTVRVPVAKLSPADKQYVSEHAGDKPSKAENPFE